MAIIGNLVLLIFFICVVHGREGGDKNFNEDRSQTSTNNLNEFGIWTAPSLKCDSGSQKANDAAACEVVVSSLTELLGLGNQANSTASTISSSSTTTTQQSTTINLAKQNMSDKQFIKRFFLSRFAKNSGNNDNRNQICCSLLNFDILRDRCCQQLKTFCEATAGRPNACQCPLGQAQGPMALTAGNDHPRCTFMNWLTGSGNDNMDDSSGESGNGLSALLIRGFNWLKNVFTSG